jgi:hypothetical protein
MRDHRKCHSFDLDAIIGYFSHKQAFYFAVVPGGLFVGIFGFLGDKARTNPMFAEKVVKLRKQNERKKAEKKDA